MPPDTEEFTLGVEEEFLLVDGASRRLVPAAQRVLEEAQRSHPGHMQHELQLCQVETTTGVCQTLDELRAEVVDLRRAIAAAAERAGCCAASSGTHPMDIEDGSHLTPKSAYKRLEDDYQLVSREQVVCGCHVHVAVPDGEAAIHVINRVRPWLHVLLALTANSPFWNGGDTGYASFRTEVWQRWPLAGPPEVFASRAEYDQLVKDLQATGSVDAPARIYWDVRLSARFPTVEFRVTDACLRADETVMLAGLVRALVRTTYEETVRGEPLVSPRPELVRAANWRAARYGVDGELVDLRSCRSAPAAEVVEDLLHLVGAALDGFGDRDEVVGLVRQVQEAGTGAARQRAVASRRHSLEDVVDFVIAETIPPA